MGSRQFARTTTGTHSFPDLLISTAAMGLDLTPHPRPRAVTPTARDSGSCGGILVTRSDRCRAGGQGPGRRALGRLLGGLVLLAAGCRGGGAPAGAPSFSPVDAAKAALAEFDANKDGALD